METNYQKFNISDFIKILRTKLLQKWYNYENYKDLKHYLCFFYAKKVVEVSALIVCTSICDKY